MTNGVVQSMKKTIFLVAFLLFLFGCTENVLVIPSSINSFLDLNDTPNSYSDQNNKIVTVNSAATALVFTDANTIPDVNNANFLDGLDSLYFWARGDARQATSDWNFLGGIFYRDTNFFQSILPTTNNTQDLGATSLRWNDLFLGGNLSNGVQTVSVANIVTIGTTQTISGAKTFYNANPGITYDTKSASLTLTGYATIPSSPNQWQIEAGEPLQDSIPGIRIFNLTDNKSYFEISDTGMVMVANGKDLNLFDGNLTFNRSYNHIILKGTPANQACAGLSKLGSGGRTVVTTKCADGNYMVNVQRQSYGGFLAAISVTRKGVGSFDVNSAGATDTAEVFWEIKKFS